MGKSADGSISVIHTKVTFNFRPERQGVLCLHVEVEPLRDADCLQPLKLKQTGYVFKLKENILRSLYYVPVIMKTLEDKTMNEIATRTSRTIDKDIILVWWCYQVDCCWQIDDSLYKVIFRIFLMLFFQGFCWAFVSLGQ